MIHAVLLNRWAWEVLKGPLNTNKSFTPQVNFFYLQIILNMRRRGFPTIRLSSSPSLHKVNTWLRLRLRELMETASFVL